jgi:hypothetical protein
VHSLGGFGGGIPTYHRTKCTPGNFGASAKSAGIPIKFSMRISRILIIDEIQSTYRRNPMELIIFLSEVGFLGLLLVASVDFLTSAIG